MVDASAKIQEWCNLVAQLKAFKARESALRAELIEHCFETPPPEGVLTLELGHGYKLKSNFRQNYTINGAIEVVLEELEKTGVEGVFVAGRIVRWKPELVLSEYRALKPEHVAIVNKGLIVKASVPTLEIVGPKGAE